jgi:hypothetical protein
MIDLLAIGNALRAGYNTSIAEGHAVMNAHFGPGVRVYHVPELPGDGTPVDLSKLGPAAEAETSALAKLEARINVETVRQTGDDTIVLETVFTGTLPNGSAFRFPNVLIYTFDGDKVSRLIEVASAEMWSTLQQAFIDLGFPIPSASG